ncbi:MAG: 1-aminocyclopropane-1-carboxylate deaminase/D-cysteine desulfhydrase [Christensenellaceae bacterium]
MYIDKNKMTPIQNLENETNNLYIKREDFFPFSFGGNKARKAELFFNEIDLGGFDCVVTYGSGSSNHCRVVSNMAAKRGLKCYIISPQEASEETFNSKLMLLFGASIQIVPVSLVHDTIENTLTKLREAGKKPYFIPGGGHGNIGTQAYVNCYEEILQYEKNNNIKFDYIFHASGTGTTQAGLVCGKILHKARHNIVGISIARKNPRGREVIIDSEKEYLASLGISHTQELLNRNTVFLDEYVSSGYGNSNEAIKKTIEHVMIKYGIPLDETYTGKAFYGMIDYIKNNKIVNKNVLFIHTGGTPLFFDYLRK